MELIDQCMCEVGGDIIVAVMRVRHGYEEKKESLEVRGKSLSRGKERLQGRK